MTTRNYTRRRYTVEGESLDKARRIELIVKIDGVVMVQMQAREPGLLAFVSRADEQGFRIEVVEATGPRYIDLMQPEEIPEPLDAWQRLALGIP